MTTLILPQDEELNKLETLLAKDDWRPNQNWKVEHVWEAPQFAAKKRWSYHTSLQQEEQLNNLIYELTNNSVNPDESVLLDSETSLARIHRLAKQKTLNGWNASILWAQRDPQNAIRIAPQLEALVLGKCRYQKIEVVKLPERTEKQSTKEITVRGQSPDTNSNTPVTLKNNEPKTEWLDKLKEKTGQYKTHSTWVDVSISMRAAAAEAWCKVLTSQPGDPLDHLAPIGHALELDDLPAELRAELYLGIAAWVAPVDVPQLSEFLREPKQPNRQRTKHILVQNAALDSCLIHAYERTFKQEKEKPQSRRTTFQKAPWPETVHKLRLSKIAEQRSKYGLWLVFTNHPDTLNQLDRLSRDTNRNIQTASYKALGYFGSREALAELKIASQSQSMIKRQNAICGLAVLGTDHLAPFLTDKSVLVRRKATAEFLVTPDVNKSAQIRNLFTDSRREIHTVILTGLKSWPDNLALPLLLYGIQESPFLDSRKECLTAIQARTGSDRPFPVEDVIEARRLQALEWAKSSELPCSLFSNLGAGTSETTQQEFDVRNTELNARLKELGNIPTDRPEHQRAINYLKRVTEADAYQLEKLATQHPLELQTIVYEQILPEIHPIYKAVAQLKNSDLAVRRKAAITLQQFAQKRSLPPHLVAKLKDIMIKEYDQLVWRSIMYSMLQDKTPQTAEVAMLAIHHHWADIRLLGCQYLELNSQPQYAEWLRPLLQDKNRAVQSAAISAAGKCRNPNLLYNKVNHSETTHPDELGLESLLVNANNTVRFELISAMSQLGHQNAIQELSLLGGHPDRKVRIQAIKAMGESGQARFLNTLIQLGATEQDATAKRELLGSLEKLAAYDKRPQISNISSLPVEQQLNLWKDALSQQNYTSTAPSVSVRQNQF